MRFKNDFIDAISLSYFFIFTLQMIILGLLQDKLLFKTDFMNLSLFCLSLSFILFLPLLVLAILISGLGKGSATFKKILTALCITDIFFGCIIFGVEILSKQTIPLKTFVLVCFALYFLVFVLMILKLRSEEIRSKMILLSKTVIILSFTALITLHIYYRYQKSADTVTHPKNIIMIVLDGLSTKYIAPYHQEAYTPGFDEIAKESLVFTNARSNFVSTFYYFSILYSGRKSRDIDDNNVISLLQKNGINTRWSVYHNNAVPDVGTREWIHGKLRYGMKYKGLRSAFLTQNYTVFPELFGLDYNVFLATGESRGVQMGPREQTIYAASNSMFPLSSFLEHHVIDEIKSLRRQKRPFFFIFHTNYGAHAFSNKEYTNVHTLWDKKNKVTPETILENIIKRRDYQYLPKEEKAVKMWKRKYQKDVQIAAESVLKFYKHYKQQKWDQDTLLIITADHGQIFDRGKIWYNFHHDEEVARVPLILHYQDIKGIDHRLCETIDISQTILSFFDIKQPLSDNAISLLSSETKDFITALTRPSNVRKEIFLSVYTPDYKYLFNIYNKKPTIIKTRVKNWDTIPIKASVDPSKDAVIRKLPEILNDYFSSGRTVY